MSSVVLLVAACIIGPPAVRPQLPRRTSANVNSASPPSPRLRTLPTPHDGAPATFQSARYARSPSGHVIEPVARTQ